MPSSLRILDHYLEAAPFDWIEAFSKVRAQMQAAAKQASARDSAARDTASRPSLPLAKYAGMLP